MKKDAAKWIKITKAKLSSLPPPTRKQDLYRDTELRGFGVIVGTKKKSFFVERRVDGRNRRRVLTGSPNPEAARKKAEQWLARMSEGSDPNPRHRNGDGVAACLHEALEGYIGRKALKPNTAREYRRIRDTVFSDWSRLRLSAITRPMIRERFTLIKTKNGPAIANLAMRVLRAVFNDEIRRRDELRDSGIAARPLTNPVACLHGKDWCKIRPRSSVIPINSMTKWFEAVQSLRTDSRFTKGGLIADYLLFCLFTGMRREEVASLQWSDIDLVQNTLLVEDTKNGQPLHLPITTQLRALIELRRLDCQIGWLFPGAGKKGYLVEPKKAVAVVRERSGVRFLIHDLRRTFITTAEDLEVSRFARKCLVNHSIGSDITDSYTIRSVDRLRKPAQKIADQLVRYITVKEEPDQWSEVA